MTMRMQTLLRFGECSMSEEVIDTRTRLIRRGSGHGTSEGWFVVVRGDPLRARVAASNVALGDGQSGSRTGSLERGGRVMPEEQSEQPTRLEVWQGESPCTVNCLYSDG